jgi:hypothetical protein
MLAMLRSRAILDPAWTMLFYARSRIRLLAILILNTALKGDELKGFRSDEQRALSIRQPWAYAILHLGKDVENRPWRTHRRGRILIQASLNVRREGALKLKLDPDELPTGAIVGSVEIADCTQNSKSKWAIRGQWHWILKNPRVLAKPIPFKRTLGFMRVPSKLLNGRRFQKARRTGRS